MICIDVDGVILDFNTFFVDYNNKLYEEKLTYIPFEWNFE